MDRARQFREAAERHNGDRGRTGWRYPPELRAVAVAHCRERREAGRPFSEIVADLGITLVSLSRWHLFVSRNRIRAKVLLWDGTGLCLYAKRLERGRFACLWRRQEGETLELSPNELRLFLEGCELVGQMRLSPPPMSKKDFLLSRGFGKIAA